MNNSTYLITKTAFPPLNIPCLNIYTFTEKDASNLRILYVICPLDFNLTQPQNKKKKHFYFPLLNPAICFIFKINLRHY